MPVLLRLDSSAAEDGFSRALTGVFADAWVSRGPSYTVVARDLHAEALPHLADASLHWPPRLRPADAPDLPEADARQRMLLDELLAADALLVAAPMYNYSMPSTLKAWIDHIHVPGVTAPFGTDTRPMRGRPAVVVSTQGAIYDDGTEAATWDHVLPPLRLVLGNALGMRVETVTVDRTLSASLPALAGERERFEEQYAAAQARLGALAASMTEQYSRCD